MQEHIKTTLQQHEIELLKQLREKRRTRQKPSHVPSSMGESIADKVAALVGSWPFVIVQSIILFSWIILNITAYIKKWDPYPFILLNLFLSFQAAYTAPIIMMSQNRQSSLDRKAAENDYNVNLKAELEIELLHQKIDMLREKEISELITVIGNLQKRLDELTADTSKGEDITV